jgi:AraC family transcriptional regulator
MPDRPVPPRDEYLARIHRVQDHIERHLAEVLRLEDLARVACFSPFHFHRIYAAVTGETIHEFVSRLRLERAAGQLLRFPERSVTEIALDAGFGGSAAFARAFRAAYGATATELRKIGKPLRKRGEEAPEAEGYVAPVGAAPDGPDAAAAPRVTSMSGQETKGGKAKKPADAIRVEELPAFTVAYVRHVGPYQEDPGLFGRLFGRLGQWAGPRGLIGKDTRWLAMFHDDPEVTPPEKLRVSACLSVPAGTPGERDVNVMELPAGKCAVARFSIQGKEWSAAWNWLMGEWLPASGYQPDDRPCYEVYLSQPGEPVMIADIVQPVKAL